MLRLIRRCLEAGMPLFDMIAATNVRAFFRDMGVTDDNALDAAARFLGDESDLGTLSAIRDKVLHGCYTSAEALRWSLESDFGVSSDAQKPVVDALLALREFKRVEYAIAVRIYCGSELDIHRAKLEQELSSFVPEWFFPALCKVAAKVNQRYGQGGLDNPRQAFEERVTLLLKFWQYGTSDGAQGGKSGAIAHMLGHAWRTLAANTFPNRWVLPSATDLEDVLF